MTAVVAQTQLSQVQDDLAKEAGIRGGGGGRGGERGGESER